MPRFLVLLSGTLLVSLGIVWAVGPVRLLAGLIAVTAYGRDADRERSRAVGIDHHLVKPVEPELLRHLLAGSGPRQHGP